ncbi:hypothetical protein [Nitrobacter sp.]|uniref:hypothetical protein n=1 Tax=unclassified Nitrobacter TaxID=2620411 RepID=UPI00321FB53B
MTVAAGSLMRQAGHIPDPAFAGNLPDSGNTEIPRFSGSRGVVAYLWRLGFKRLFETSSMHLNMQRLDMQQEARNLEPPCRSLPRLSAGARP